MYINYWCIKQLLNNIHMSSICGRTGGILLYRMNICCEKNFTLKVKILKYKSMYKCFILLSRLTPYVEQIIGDHQYGFRHNRSTTDHISGIHQILEKKLEYNKAMHQLFRHFKKAYDSVRREVLYNILIEFGIPMKLEKLFKICLTETYSRVPVGENLSDMFPVRNGLKQGDLYRHFFSVLL